MPVANTGKGRLISLCGQAIDYFDNRSAEQQDAILEALQLLKEDKSFRVVITETIKSLCLSTDPVKIQQGWQQLYQQWQLELSIPEVPFDQKRIAAEKKRGRILIFVWETLATQEGLITLGNLFPAMGSWSTKSDSSVVVDLVMSGWLFVESSLDAPNRNTTEKQLRDTFAKQNSTGYGLPVYIVFGQFCGEVFGEYPDIKTRSRLLGSSHEGDVLYAYFYSDGYLGVSHHLYPGLADGSLGGRSSAV